MLSFAGVPLEQPSEAALAFLEARLRPEDLYDFAHQRWPGQGLAGLGPTATRRDRPPKLNSLLWPAGASRFAVGYFLTNEASLAKIRQQVYSGTNGTATAQPLVLSDGRRSLTTNLWMLPPRPLGSNAAGNGWLLTLVDERYWWWQEAANITVTPGTTAWTDLYTAIAAALGVTLTVDAIPAAYLKPTGDFGTPYPPLPVLLDAVAKSCGQRIARGFDGTVRAWNATAARDQALANLALNPVYAGGKLLLDGTVSPNDLDALLPASVTVTFPISDTATGPDGTDQAYTTTLSSLALPDMGGATGATGRSKVLHSTAVASRTSGVITNDAELSALASQLATDTFRWTAARADCSLSGVPQGYVPEPGHDLEICHPGDRLYARVQRGPWDERDSEVKQQGSAGSTSYTWIDVVWWLIRVTINLVSVTINVYNTLTWYLYGPVIINPPPGTVTGPTGPPGPTGPAGKTGLPGPPGWIDRVPLKIDDWLFWGGSTKNLSGADIGQNTLTWDNWLQGGDTRLPAASQLRRVVWRVNPDGVSGGVTLTGIYPAVPPDITDPLNGQVLILLNVGNNYDLVLANEDANSLGFNRIKTPGGFSLHVQPGGGVGLWYDWASQRWRCFTVEAGGPTGAGARVVDSIDWVNCTNTFYTPSYVNGRWQS